MRTVYVESDRTLTLDEVRHGNVLVLAAGVDATLPYPAGRDCLLTVKADGASCTIISAAGIEDDDGSDLTTAIALADGEARTLASYRDTAAGTQSGWKLVGQYTPTP